MALVPTTSSDSVLVRHRQIQHRTLSTVVKKSTYDRVDHNAAENTTVDDLWRLEEPLSYGSSRLRQPSRNWHTFFNLESYRCNLA